MFKILYESRSGGMFTDCCYGLYETGYPYGDSCNTNTCKTPTKEDNMNLADMFKDNRYATKPFVSGDCFVPNQAKLCYNEWQVKQYCAEYINCCTIAVWNDSVNNDCDSLKLNLA